VLKGLKKKQSSLNGRKGDLVSCVAADKWTIQVLKDDGSPDGPPQTFAPANFTQVVDASAANVVPSAAVAAATARVVELAPSGKSTPLAAIPLTESFLPLSDQTQSEVADKAYLKSQRGWKDPQCLEAYSVRGEHRDLVAYFDAEDETSPLNELASKTFCGYKKVAIRGSVVITRAEPPLSLNFGESPFGSGPMPTAFAAPSAKQDLDLAELRETLVFYTTNDVRKIAQQRDFQRASGSFKQMQAS
jgi:hypothetical protein